MSKKWETRLFLFALGGIALYHIARFVYLWAVEHPFLAFFFGLGVFYSLIYILTKTGFIKKPNKVWEEKPFPKGYKKAWFQGDLPDISDVEINNNYHKRDWEKEWFAENHNIEINETPKRSPRYVPQSVRRAVWSRDGGQCVECGSREGLEYDHLIPYSRGGSNSEQNIQLLCRGCNRKKSDRI